MRYAIVVFPKLDAARAVESVRRRFDPQASMLPAHVTLVFPFEDEVSEVELTRHIAGAVADRCAFDVTLSAVSVGEGGYVFLDVGTGADVLRELHDRLYTGLLASHLSSAHAYRPHVTIGRLRDADQAPAAAEEARMHLELPFRGRVGEIALFRIGEANRGDVAHAIRLARA